MTKKQEDLIFKDVTEYEKEVFLKKLGIESKIKILNPTEIRFIDAETLIADVIIELDDVILIIEFQSTRLRNRDKNRFLAYYSVVNHKKKTKKKVKLIIVSTAEKSKKVVHKIDDTVQFKFDIFSLRDYDGDLIIDKIEKKIKNNSEITTEELIDLSLSPLMNSKNTVEEQVERSVKIILSLNLNSNEELKNIINGVSYLLVDKFIEDEEKKKVICDALGGKMNAVYDYGQRREEDGIKKGKEEGIKEGIKETAKNMIKDGVKDEDIKKYTKLNDKKIKEIKEELEKDI